MATRWPIKELGLAGLDLDLRNVRIPEQNLGESAIANYLVEAADLLDLVRDILRDGYIDNELPVVVVENGRHVVLEGNRRITALKAIKDPSLLGKSAPRIERLISRYPETGVPAKVRIMVAPSREAAQPLLARLHTRNPKKSWIREQQAVFYHAQLSDSVKVNALRAQYPSETSLISGFIRMGEMREVIRNIRYEDPRLDDFVKTSQLKMTSFEYAYDKPKIQQALGLAFNKDGLLASKKLSEGQRLGLIYLLERFQAGTLNTRSPELRSSTSEHDGLVSILIEIVNEAGGIAGASPAAEEVSGATAATEPTSEPLAGTSDVTQPATEAPRTQPPAEASQSDGTPKNPKNLQGGGNVGSTANGSNGNSSHTATGANSGPATAGQPTPRGPNRGETRSRLDMEGFDYKGTSPGLRRRFEELKRLDVRDSPNATYDLLRTILECAIKDHFVTHRQTRLSGKQIGACMTELIAAYRQDQRMTSLINSVNRRGAMPAAQYTGTTESLNANNHEPDSFVIGKDVHEAWDRLKPILIEIVGK